MLSDYQTLVTDLARDDAGKVSAAQQEAAIQAAVRRYSQDRPKEAAEDLTPVSANLLPLPTAWETDFSTLLSLEYPIGDVPPTLIDHDRIAFYRSPSAVRIMLADAVAVAASNTRATFTIKHTVSDAADTIPVHHREAVACWAAAMLCDELATFYAAGTDSAIQADSVRQDSKAREYAMRAKDLRKRYLDELGVDPKRNQAAGAMVELKRPDSFGGERILHPSLTR